MKNKKILILVLLLTLLLVFSLGGCSFLARLFGRDNGTDDEPSPTDQPLTEQEILNLTSNPIDTSSSFTLYIVIDTMGVSGMTQIDCQVVDGIPNLRIEKENDDATGTEETYILKLAGEYGFQQIEVSRSYVGETTTKVKRLSEIQAQMKMNSLILDTVPFLHEYIPEIKKLGLLAKSYDSSLGNLEMSGVRHINAQNQLESIEINASSKIVLDFVNRAGAFSYYNKFNSQTKLTEAKVQFILDKEYLPTNYDYETTSKKDILSANVSIEYGNVSIQTPNLDNAINLDASEIQIQLVDNYGVTLDGLYQESFITGSEIGAGDVNMSAQTVEMQFQGIYYDSDYKYPIGNTINTGFTTPLRLYCNWKGTKVNLQLNGGVLEEEQEYFILGKYTDLEPIRSGYEFGGWYKDQNYTEKLESWDATLTDTAITLYAKWTPYVKITLNAGVSYKLLPIIGVAGKPIAYPVGDAINKKGHLFDDWWQDAALTQVKLAAFPAASTTAYASFKEAWVVTLSQHADYKLDHLPKYVNIAKNPANPATAFNALIQKITEGNNAITFGGEGGGYIFDKWYLDSAFTTPFTEYPTGNITLYAGFKTAQPI